MTDLADRREVAVGAQIGVEQPGTDSFLLIQKGLGLGRRGGRRGKQRKGFALRLAQAEAEDDTPHNQGQEHDQNGFGKADLTHQGSGAVEPGAHREDGHGDGHEHDQGAGDNQNQHTQDGHGDVAPFVAQVTEKIGDGAKETGDLLPDYGS